MKKLKILVCLAFIFAVAAIELIKSTPAAGQITAAELAAPTGITATDNLYNNKVGIYWDAIRGATNYRIFRGTTNNQSTSVDIGTTAAASFFDTTAAPNQTFFYWVRAENSTTLSLLSAPDQGTRTNTTQPGPVPPIGPPPVPPGNPVTAAKAYLGKALFWDEQMGSTRTQSCGSCHHASTGGIDPRSGTAGNASLNPGPDGLLITADDIRGSIGVPANNLDGTYAFTTAYGLNEQVTGRRTMSYIDAAYTPLLFWDGRAGGQFRDPLTNTVVLNNGGALENQILGPPVSSVEMAHNGRNWTDVATRITTSRPLALAPSIPTALTAWIDGRTYPDLFAEAFGTADVTPTRIALAIATYERTLYSDQTPLDQVNAGIGTLTPAEVRGRGIFGGAARCATCHGGQLTTDDNFHFDGVRPQSDDTGRFQVTGFNNDRGKFRTPSLRNSELRGSYFHNGVFTTLEQVVAFYSRGGDFPPSEITPIGLNAAQQADLVAFLKRPFTDPRVAAELPPFDRPTLYMESNRVPQITGAGRPGSGGFAPVIKAISPPITGNPNFTVSVSSALGNAGGVLVIDAADPGVGTTIPATGSFARLTANTQNTGNGNGWASLSLPIPDNAALVGKTFFARWYIQDAGAVNGFSVTPAARFIVFGAAAAPAKAKFVDFDGDGKTDVSVYRPAEGNWYIHRSSDNTFTAVTWGISTDTLTPGDYDGDRKTDVAVYRDGTWYLWKSRDGFTGFQFGLPGDIPQPGDFDGDGIDDMAVYRPSDGVWYIQQSRDGFVAKPFGIATDRPVSADYDGDGKADPAVYRNGSWWILKSSGGTLVTQFGLSDDKPVVGDYDGDGKADIAVWRPSTGVWYHIRSSDGVSRGATFGAGTDVPSPGDYDGDGSNDFTVYRPSSGMWYILGATGAFRAEAFGASQDKPIPSALVP